MRLLEGIGLLLINVSNVGNYFRGESMEDECKHCSNGYCMVFDCICNGVNLCGVDE